MQAEETRRDLQKAKNMLYEGGLTCVLVRGETRYVSSERGIAPMLRVLERGVDVQGAAAADTIVGRAAALLFVLAGVAAVHARTISRPAIDVLERAGIDCTFDTATDGIVNRVGTGPCPMEQAVAGIDDPQTARCALRQAFLSLGGAL